MTDQYISKLGDRRQFENTLINQWKKFLLLIDRKGAEHFRDYWKSFPSHLRTPNTIELIQFVDQYLADLPLWSTKDTMVPAEFNLDSYQEVITDLG